MAYEGRCIVRIVKSPFEIRFLTFQAFLTDIIACNVQSESGKCIMVDYDGREVKETLSKVIEGKTATVPLGNPTAVPAALSEWAANVMVLNVATVTAKPKARRQRGLRL